MNPGSIWWNQIGTSLRLLSQITSNLQDCRSAVLQVPQTFPWRQDFYNAIDIRRSPFSAERRLVRLTWDKKSDPGQFILNELCSELVRAEYYPGLSYASYLSARDDLILNDYYIWITGIHSRAEILRWSNFVDEYVRLSQQYDQRAVFILEYDGPPAGSCTLETISYVVENYDCRVFALEAASALRNSSLLNYQAEVALSICKKDPELCYALLLAGNDLLQNPVPCALDVIAFDRSSEGLPFAPLNEQQLTSAVWEAAIVLMFPILERYRVNFIKKYALELSSKLPITDSNGSKVTDPQDLELGSLYYIVSSSHTFPPAEVKAIRLCRKIRNLLAHNKIASLEDILSLFEL